MIRVLIAFLCPQLLTNFNLPWWYDNSTERTAQVYKRWLTINLFTRIFAVFHLVWILSRWFFTFVNFVVCLFWRYLNRVRINSLCYAVPIFWRKKKCTCHEDNANKIEFLSDTSHPSHKVWLHSWASKILIPRSKRHCCLTNVYQDLIFNHLATE